MIYNHDKETHNTVSARIIVPDLIEMFKPSSVLDIGCGLGEWLKVFQENGVSDVQGINNPQARSEDFYVSKEHIMFLDLNNPEKLDRKFGLALCLEVAEHLSYDKSSELIDFICDCSDIIIFSAAVPFQGGDNHFNEQWPEYWAQKFLKNDFVFLDVLRLRYWERREVRWWYKQNIFVAIRKDRAQKEFSDLLNKNSPHAYIHPELYLKKTKNIEDIINGRVSVLMGLKIFIKSVVVRLRNLFRKLSKRNTC